MIGSLQGILNVREICNHNLRFRLPSKSNICLICHCNKINDVISTEKSGNRKLSSTNIREIIHQFRVLNSVLDVPIEPNLVETLLTPVLQTSLAALKIHNDEVGTVVSQALEKISPRVPKSLLENFLEKLSAQILEKSSFGNLECLLVLLRWKECLYSFLKNYGSILLPSLFQLLEAHVPRIIFKCPSVPSSLTKIRKPSSAPNDSSADRSGKDSLRLVEKLFDVLEASCPTDISLVVADKENNESFQQFSYVGQEESFQIFRQYMKGIIEACMNLLSYSHSSETVPMTSFHIKILRFLEKLCHRPETLQFILSDSRGVAFCSMIKRLLYTHSVDVKTAALSLVNRMLVTYKHPVDDNCADKVIIEDFPSVISQVDLIHFITEAMNTSSENLFRMALIVLDQINSIPLFRQGGMVPVLESTLRISTMRIPNNIAELNTYTILNSFLLNVFTSLESIPPGIRHQLMYLFERLPKDWTATQYLPWIKLLIFCGREAELQGNLWNVFVSFAQRGKNLGNYCYVTPLKCVLLIACALIECTSQPKTSSNALHDQKYKIMLAIMNPDFLPALMVMALFSHGTLEDSIYLIILLDLLKLYPNECLQIGKSSSSEQGTLKTVKVVYDSPLSNVEETKDTNENFYEIEILENAVFKTNGGFWCWTPRVLMKILGAIRLNSDLMVNRQLFELWNENMSRIMAFCCTHHLPQLHTVLDINYDGAPEEKSSLQGTIRCHLEGLDIDATCWSKILGKVYGMSEKAGAEDSKLQDVVLAFYFCYALFACKDITQFLDDGFLKRLSNFLDSCVDRHNETQEIQDFGWTVISFYFRIALMIASCLPRNSEDAAILSKKFELLSLEALEYETNFKYDVMVYHCDVFVYLFREKFFTAYELLVEIWMRKDSESCIWFFECKSFDKQLDTVINNCLIAMAARGNKENSALAVQLGCKRLMKYKTGFEFTFFMASMYELMRQILIEETSERGRNSINFSRLSNVMQLAVRDEFLLSPENHFPLDFLRQVVTIMLKYHDASLIGKKSLELLSKILRDDIAFKNASPYLADSSDFVCFLGSMLYSINKEDPEASVHAHKLLTLLIRQKMKVSSVENCPAGESRSLITWKLSSVLSYIHEVPNVEILEFITTIFKVNFKCQLIQVEELNSPRTFQVVLLNLLFHLQALVLKVTTKAARDAIWELLCEYIRLASDENEAVTGPTFKSDVLFQPFMKVTVIRLLSGSNNMPSKLSLKQLQFLQNWTEMMLKNKLNNPSRRSPILEKMVFQSYVELFKKISDVMKKDRSQAVPTKKEPHSGPSQSLKQHLNQSHIFDIERKTKLISQISKHCDIFLSCF